MTTYQNSLDIPASAEDIFAAIGDPARLVRWWGPAGFTNTSHACEFKNGGRWALTMHGPDGSDYPGELVFAEIEPARRVVVLHDSPPAYRLEIDLKPSGAGTIVSWTQTFADAELGKRMEHIVVPANRQNLERLAEEVQRHRAA